jgi:hypothetical protein
MITPVINPVMTAFLIVLCGCDVLKYMKYLNNFHKIFL